jgi:hypothetical protein
METITILGDGHLGQAIAAALAARGDRARLAGRPDNGGTHPRASFDGADVVVDASRGDAVLGNLRAATGGFDASVVEWHRRAKLDRPSGTAREIVRRLSGSFPIDVDEVAVVRSGWMPGHHEVVLDRESETIELRLTARDRSGYAAGALAAIDWLRGAPRPVGLHPFDEVVDEILAIPDRSPEVVAMPR